MGPPSGKVPSRVAQSGCPPAVHPPAWVRVSPRPRLEAPGTWAQPSISARPSTSPGRVDIIALQAHGPSVLPGIRSRMRPPRDMGRPPAWVRQRQAEENTVSVIKGVYEYPRLLRIVDYNAVGPTTARTDTSVPQTPHMAHETTTRILTSSTMDPSGSSGMLRVG